MPWYFASETDKKSGARHIAPYRIPTRHVFFLFFSCTKKRYTGARARQNSMNRNGNTRTAIYQRLKLLSDNSHQIATNAHG